LSIQRLDDSLAAESEAPAPVVASHVEGYLNQLENLAESLREISDFGILNGVTISAAVSLATAAYLVWSIRSGYLAASMLASLPAWMRVDPLPVLDFAAATSRSRGKDEDELELLPSGGI
jgi:hypothetical protein